MENLGLREGGEEEKQPHVGVQTYPKPRLTPFSFLFSSRPCCAWENQPCWENEDGSSCLSQGGVLKEVEDTVARAHGSIMDGVRLEMNKAL